MAKERRLAICRKHWGAFWKRELLTVFLLVGTIYWLAADKITIDTLLFLILAILCLVLSIFISYKSDYIVLTETKVIGKKGFIKSATITMPISNVQDVRISNGLMGKLLGYQNITITNAGTSGREYQFKAMANANAFADAVEDEIARNTYR